ncbi:MAG TPA: hypothetical protein VL860_05130 [Planctomycetota bacterium]|nr:hypothetical protein [Planctomycetota bacterium]
MRTRFLLPFFGLALLLASGCGDSQAGHENLPAAPKTPGALPATPGADVGPTPAPPEQPAGNKADMVYFNAVGSDHSVKPPEAPWKILDVPDSEAVASTKVLFLEDRVNEKLGKQEILCGGQKDYAFPGTVEYQFELAKADSYVTFVHANFQDDCGNSVFVKVDDGPIYRIEYAVAKEFNTEYKWTCPLSEGNPVTLKLEAGKHTMTLLNREDGIKIDQILICSKKLAPKFDQLQAPIKK